MKKISWPRLSLPRFILIFAFSIIAINVFYTFVYIMSQVSRMDIPILEPGSQYAEFRPFLKDRPSAGYVTNRDMSPEHNDGGFLQAQYCFAPTVIRLHDPEHEYVILDFTDNVYMFYSLEELNARPVADTIYSKVLARRQWP